MRLSGFDQESGVRKAESDPDQSHDPSESGRSRRLDLTGIASARAQAQYALDVVLGSAESAADRSYRFDALNGAGVNFLSLGCKALVLTVDIKIQELRKRDMRIRFTVPQLPELKLA